MEKSNWEQPLATVEYFMANEYVAACWKVRCEVPYEGPMYNDNAAYDPIVENDINNLHRKDFCGADDAFEVVTDEQENPKELIEIAKRAGSTGGTKSLGTEIYEDAAFSVKKSITTVQPGQTIYFTTSNGGRTWYHHGTVSGSGNHS